MFTWHVSSAWFSVVLLGLTGSSAASWKRILTTYWTVALRIFVFPRGPSGSDTPLAGKICFIVFPTRFENVAKSEYSGSTVPNKNYVHKESWKHVSTSKQLLKTKGCDMTHLFLLFATIWAQGDLTHLTNRCFIRCTDLRVFASNGNKVVYRNLGRKKKKKKPLLLSNWLITLIQRFEIIINHKDVLLFYVTCCFVTVQSHL